MNLFEEKKDCCGCWVCANICPKNAIEMQEDKEGFLYPDIDDELCVECGLCISACPIKKSRENLKRINSQKHIGIINLQFTNNYGAVIAAAALEDTVRDIVGNDFVVNTINYFPYKKMPNKVIQKLDEIKQWGGFNLYIKVLTSTKTTDSALSEKRDQRFKVFRSEFLNLTPRVNDAFEINKDVNYRAFITGSDVVWASKRTDNFRADGYYLKFADKGERRIAFAPSLDNKVNSKLKRKAKYYKKALKGLDYVSVREQSNVDFIQSLTDKKVHQCCDPAFLVDSSYYDKMIDIADVERDGEKYIYVYILEVNDEIVSYANKLAKEKGLKICYYSANHKQYDYDSEDCTADGPAEFLYRLKNAEYVLTNSFHCVVFSLLFKRQFLSFTRSGISIKSTDLLDYFDMNDRLFVNNQNIDKPIDFEKVREFISTMREKSLNYLTDSLSDIK